MANRRQASAACPCTGRTFVKWQQVYTEELPRQNAAVWRTVRCVWPRATHHPAVQQSACCLLQKVAAWLMSSRCACLFSDQPLEQMLLELNLGWRSLAQRTCASDAAPCASRAQNLTPAADRGLSVPTLPQTVLQLASRSGTLKFFQVHSPRLSSASASGSLLPGRLICD